MVFADAKVVPKTEMKVSKKICYQHLCQSANMDPWGNAYRALNNDDQDQMASTKPYQLQSSHVMVRDLGLPL